MAALLQRTIDTIARNQTALLGSWKSDLQEMGGFHNVKPEELTQQTAEFIHLLISGTADGSADIAGPAWDAMRSYRSACRAAAPCWVSTRSRPPASSSPPSAR